MTKIPAYIINFNRLGVMSRLADWLADTDSVYPVIVDNNSDYPPLLEYYKTTPHKVMRMDKNYGQCCLWVAPNLIEELNLYKGNYIVTDSDIDMTGVKKDFLSVMQKAMEDNRHWGCDKVGLALRIDDLPVNDFTKEVIAHEKGQWREMITPDIYKAAVDTSFCLLSSEIHSFNSVRVAGDYTCRHTPWYAESYESLPDDEKYYLKSIGKEHSHWSVIYKQKQGL